MNNKDTILRYLSEQMNKSERRLFEQELENSDELRKEFKQIKDSLEFLKKSQPESADERYFNRLLPSVREKLEESSRFLSPKPALSFAFSVIIVVFIVIILRVGGPEESISIYSSLEEAVQQIALTEDYNNYEQFLTESYYHGTYSEYGNDVSKLLEDEYMEEITSSSNLEANLWELHYLEEYYLLNTIKEDEFNKLYQDLKNTKIL